MSSLNAPLRTEHCSGVSLALAKKKKKKIIMSIITIHARLCRGENSDAPPRQSHPLPVEPARVG